HELCHSLVALRYKIRVISITVFLFGGLARIGRDPDKAIQEFNIAVAGPISSYLLCGFFFILYRFAPVNEIIRGSFGSLAWSNGLLATFNLLPGFPLDGGRILRAIIWGRTKDYSRATRMAGASGRLIAYGIILLGIWYAAFKGQWESGLWFA